MPFGAVRWKDKMPAAAKNRPVVKLDGTPFSVRFLPARVVVFECPDGKDGVKYSEPLLIKKVAPPEPDALQQLLQRPAFNTLGWSTKPAQPFASEEIVLLEEPGRTFSAFYTIEGDVVFQCVAEHIRGKPPFAHYSDPVEPEQFVRW
jgi:hypothetical protein